MQIHHSFPESHSWKRSQPSALVSLMKWAEESPVPTKKSGKFCGQRQHRIEWNGCSTTCESGMPWLRPRELCYQAEPLRMKHYMLKLMRGQGQIMRCIKALCDWNFKSCNSASWWHITLPPASLQSSSAANQCCWRGAWLRRIGRMRSGKHAAKALRRHIFLCTRTECRRRRRSGSGMLPMWWRYGNTMSKNARFTLWGGTARFVQLVLRLHQSEIQCEHSMSQYQLWERKRKSNPNRSELALWLQLHQH